MDEKNKQEIMVVKPISDTIQYYEFPKKILLQNIVLQINGCLHDPKDKEFLDQKAEILSNPNTYNGRNISIEKVSVQWDRAIVQSQEFSYAHNIRLGKNSPKKLAQVKENKEKIEINFHKENSNGLSIALFPWIENINHITWETVKNLVLWLTHPTSVEKKDRENIYPWAFTAEMIGKPKIIWWVVEPDKKINIDYLIEETLKNETLEEAWRELTSEELDQVMVSGIVHDQYWRVALITHIDTDKHYQELEDNYKKFAENEFYRIDMLDEEKILELFGQQSLYWYEKVPYITHTTKNKK